MYVCVLYMYIDVGVRSLSSWFCFPAYMYVYIYISCYPLSPPHPILLVVRLSVSDLVSKLEFDLINYSAKPVLATICSERDT